MYLVTEASASFLSEIRQTPGSTAHQRAGGLFALASAIGTIAVGVLVLLGWILDIDALRRFLPGVTNPMVATTASCFVLLGSALLLVRGPHPSRARRLAACAAALIAVGVGLLVLGGYAFGWDLGLDRFLYRASARPFTGAMAVPTAITFVLLGSAVLMLVWRQQRPGLGQTLALAGGIAPLLGLVGRAYGVPSLSSYVSGTVVMALHTALTFVLLVVGILAARPHDGIMRTFTAREPGGWLLRTLLLPAWAVVIIVGLLRLVGERAGIYGTEFGTSLFAIASILLLTALMLLGARSLNRADAQRKQAEGRFLESEHRGLLVLASMGEGVVTTDEKGRILSVNPAMERMSGLRPDEVVGRLAAEVYPTRDRDGRPIPPEDRLLPKVLASGEVLANRGYDTMLVTKDGSLLPIGVTVSPILDAQGGVVGGVGVVRDVSHEREVDVMKSSLISTVSHELRTPLTMIEGFSELLLSRDLDPERAKQAAGQIHESALRLDRLVDDLLSVSRIESGSLRVRSEPIDLAALVQEVAGNFESERTVRLELDGVEEVFGDRDMVHQILTNLVSNAVKYSPDEAPVTVAATRGEKAASVSVIDAGIGMSPQEVSRLFEKFFRADRPEVRNARGTGLGLYITRGLVELQGGKIDVESTPGEGTTFTFTLPLADGKEGP